MVNYVINGKQVKFHKYSDRPKQAVDKMKDLKKCDINGKELVWIKGTSGKYEYIDGTPFTGKRTDIYRMDNNGTVLEKNERTIVIDTEQCNKLPRKFVEDIAGTSEYFCIDDKGAFNFKDDECILTPIMLSDSYDDNMKIGAFYKDMDGTVTLKIGAVLKSKQREKIKAQLKIKEAVKNLESKKLVKKAKLEAIGIKI